MHSGANNTGGQGGHAHHERYQVFTFNFDGVESAYVVSLWIFIASIAKIGMYQVVAKQRVEQLSVNSAEERASWPLLLHKTKLAN